MNARSTNRPGGRNRRRGQITRRGGGGDAGGKSFIRELIGCGLVGGLILGVPAGYVVDVVWGYLG